ncbi:hypothetical protein Tco_0958215 [Tanacetum coccineum]
MIDINTTGIALTRTSRLLRPQYCLLCPHAHRFAFVFLAWDFPQVTQTSATLTQARSTASSWQGKVKGGGVDFGVVNSFLGEIPKDVMGERGGETFGVDGKVVW